MRRFFRTLVAVPLALGVFAAAAVAQEGEPKVHLPEALQADEIVPVIVTEPGLADQQAQLMNALNSVTKAIVIETASVRGVLRDRNAGTIVEEAVEAALAAGKTKHAALDRCPWILLGFSAAAPHFAALEWRAYGRFQGLVLVNAGVTTATLQGVPAFLGREHHPVLMMHGTDDSVVPIATAREVEGILRRFKLKVTFEEIDTADHMAPLGALGNEQLGKWLVENFGSKPIQRRLVAPTRITTTSAGDLTLTGDLYDAGDKTKPVVCCFHQAASGRAEYRPIAPQLVEQGFNVLAIDQRSGNGWNAVANATAAEAVQKGLMKQGRAAGVQGYLAARADLDRAVAWVRELGYTGPLAIIGSSYSSSLAIFVAAENPEVVAVVSCSPGDYLPPKGSILEAGRKLQKPTLIICPPNEEAQAKVVAVAVGSKDKELYVQPQGQHGARTFYTSPTRADAFAKLVAFLKNATAP